MIVLNDDHDDDDDDEDDDDWTCVYCGRSLALHHITYLLPMHYISIESDEELDTHIIRGAGIIPQSYVTTIKHYIHSC